MSCGVGHIFSSDLALLWCRLAATAPIRPLAWEPPYAADVALKRPKKKKKRINGTLVILLASAINVTALTIY